MKKIKNLFHWIRWKFCTHDYELEESYSGADMHIGRCVKCRGQWHANRRTMKKLMREGKDFRITDRTKWFRFVDNKWEHHETGIPAHMKDKK